MVESRFWMNIEMSKAIIIQKRDLGFGKSEVSIAQPPAAAASPETESCPSPSPSLLVSLPIDEIVAFWVAVWESFSWLEVCVAAMFPLW